MQEKQIKMIKIKDIKRYNKNPRKNNDAIEKVANSIKEFGFKNPIIIDGENVIICRHTRHKAAQILGLKEVPCIVADDLTKEQVKAYRLADNKIGELSEWDMGLLDEELMNILDIDMSEFGFNPNICEEIIKPEKKELKPYNQVHYLISIDINEHDKYIDAIQKLKESEGVEIVSTLN